MESSSSVSPPEIRLHELPVDFLDNHRGEYHSSLGNPLTHYDPRLKKYTVDSQDNSIHPMKVPAQEHIDVESLFSKALELFRTTTEEPKHSIDAPLRIRDKHSWREVEKEVNDARDRYMDVKGIRGELRKWLRKAGDRGNVAKPYMTFIPNGTYTSILTAGGNILIDAAIRTSKVRGDLAQLVDDLPNKLQDIEDYLQIHPSEKKIHHATVQLYLKILVALEEAVRYYTEKAARHVKSVFLGAEYEKSLEEKLGDIDKAANYLIHQAEICHQHSSKIESHFQIHQTAEVSHKVDKMQNSLDSLNPLLSVLRDNVENSEWFRAERKRLKQKANARKAQIQKLTKQKALLEAQLHDVQLRSRTPSPAPKPYIAQSELVEILHKSSDTATKDRHHCAHFGRAMKMAVQDRAAWLMKSEKLKEWLTSRYSEVRLVHGNYESAKISPVSYLCSMLVESLEHLNPTRVIYFFCGRHTEPKDPLSDAYGMVKSLLVQLLSQDSFDTSFLKPGDVRKIENEELESMCDLLCDLVERLESTVVLFCIIDGINFFETSQRVHAMHAVIDRLVNMARGNSMNSIFKLLITSPTTTSRDVRQRFSNDEIVSVPHSVPRSGYGFSEKQMAARTGNDLKLWEKYKVEELEDENEEENGEDAVRGLIYGGAISYRQ
ncbi:hypothetical protein K440DRAFT_659956 [Wilcoxina mikolae CBS 423.85]|nr:hypothetical protein K440DRAFT_659956 [Wilcoxina mikolae CBS 423.85]